MARENTEPCGAELIARNGEMHLTCDRTDRHITHQDTQAGKRFTALPGGAWVTDKKK